VDGLIAVRSFHGRAAVVLNDQPLTTTWRPVCGSEGFIARALWSDGPYAALSRMLAELTDLGQTGLADPDRAIDQMVADFSGPEPRSPYWEETATRMAASCKRWVRGPSARIRTRLTAGEYLIFDAAADATNIDESLDVRLEPGEYEIVSGWHRADAENCFVLHWIRRPARAGRDAPDPPP
jgi:hypothetical protein